MTNGEINRLLRLLGLVALGSFNVSAEDGVPGYSSGTLVLVGNGGSSFWKVFRRSAEYRDGQADSLDRWSRRVGTDLADTLGGHVFFPFGGPPYLPFQRWAKRSGEVSVSRISMVMHSEYGLWHAYRFALVLQGPNKEAEPRERFASPCDTCITQPCLEACPVGAFDAEGYAVDSCVDYLANDAASACRKLGCSARRACPEGRAFTYLPRQSAFHMDAFVRSQRG